MRFMIQVRATAATEAGEFPADGTLTRRMSAYLADLANAGVLLDAAGLQPSAAGWRIEHLGGRSRVVDGPFADTKELIAGYTLIQVRDRDEAMEWARRFPAPLGEGVAVTLEVRPLVEAEDCQASAR